MATMKLGIGTAQFGLDYGISNQQGKTPPAEVAKILKLAAKNGVRLIDTASVYGTSEQVLGETLPYSHDFQIVTKTPKLPVDKITHEDILIVKQVFQQSLVNLKQSEVYGLLVHNAENLLAENSQWLMDMLLDLQSQGLVKKIGVSVYNSQQIDRVISQYPIDIIQLPINILDQRLIQSGHLKTLKAAGVEIHARSVFVQGLLLMNVAQLSPFFERVKSHLLAYHNWLKQIGITPLQSALSFVMGIPEIDYVLTGVCSAQELQEILDSLAIGENNLDFSQWSFAINEIVDPSQWRL